MYRITFLLFFCCIIQSSFSQSVSGLSVNPTGTYILKGEVKRGEINGNFAEIRAKLIGDTLLAFTMYCNNGYPEYTSACLLDTMSYMQNRVFYTSPSDPSCHIEFTFEDHGLYIKKIYTDPNSNCGLEKNVLPLGFIPRYSSATPVIQSLAR